MNEIALALDIWPLFPHGGIDCHTYLAVHVSSATLDFCAVCGRRADEHPPDSFPGDDER